MALTRTPCRPTATARLRVKADTPALNAEYTGCCGMPRKASTVELSTMLPERCSTMVGSSAWVSLNTCRRFSS